MKNAAFIFLMGLLLTTTGCNDDEVIEDPIPAPTPTLTEQEKSDLLFLREEEKLARDVYLYNFDKYGETIFDKISNSEQTHMDQVLVLLDFYNLDDPAHADRGIFINTELQSLYDDLIMLSDSSLVHGLTAGAIIEDVDIRDIVDFENNTTKDDLLVMYASLVCGSKNHIQGYSTQLSNNGVTYVPQFITQEEYDAILSGGHLTCN